MNSNGPIGSIIRPSLNSPLTRLIVVLTIGLPAVIMLNLHLLINVHSTQLLLQQWYYNLQVSESWASYITTYRFQKVEQVTYDSATKTTIKTPGKSQMKEATSLCSPVTDLINNLSWSSVPVTCSQRGGPWSCIVESDTTAEECWQGYNGMWWSPLGQQKTVEDYVGLLLLLLLLQTFHSSVSVKCECYSQW